MVTQQLLGKQGDREEEQKRACEGMQLADQTIAPAYLRLINLGRGEASCAYINQFVHDIPA